ncbi:MAG: sterol desaturase family protein [Flavobacteriaceae bacterium]|nr:sterol desaturase family protein [Bacteroidia bacterium]MBT8288139.1 sterol desaturase family protein [Bacteroidia bacterium]NNF74878.1 sterol desaturase family protein [Flavobacteriaceae bacterium]NNK74420.1 sterol desaturase family protein [Flavobacteriaceae bacterium]
METYANALLYAIPFFVILMLIEVGYGHFVKQQKHSLMDTISSLSSGMTNIIKDSLGLVLIIVSYPYLLEHLAIYKIESSMLVYVIAFIAIDFGSYWNHRLSHKVNIFWNQHVIHHSSEEFNLACALRQSISNLIGYFPILLFPAAILGVPHEVISLLAPIHLFAQFWYHTQHIGKLGIIEYILVTPSQHRVHHAINPEYIDKNLAAIFCVWDRIFGTFQKELDNVPPVYGVLKPARTWNPILINFQHIWRLCVDAWRTKNWLDKFRIWFMPTGWRPIDVANKYPRPIIEDPFNFDKYKSNPSKGLAYWSIFQLIFSLAMLLFMFYNYKSIGLPNLLLYGLIVFVGIYAYTSLMDKDKHALIAEGLKFIIGFGVIFQTADWFGLGTYISAGPIIMAFYFILSFLGTIYFLYFVNPSKKQLIKAD